MITAVGAGLCSLAPAPDDNPFAMFADWDADRVLWLAILIPAAVVVFFIGSRRFRSQLGGSALRPRGRDRLLAPLGQRRRDAQWRATVDRLERELPVAIDRATRGPARMQVEIVGASGTLGGAPGRECVWRNRADAGPQTAVAADLIIVADKTGRCGVEDLEEARVLAPVERAGTHVESVSLYLGDRVEIMAHFEPERFGEHEDPTQLVYGTLGGRGRVEIRLVERPPHPEAATPAETDDKAESQGSPSGGLDDPDASAPPASLDQTHASDPNEP